MPTLELGVWNAWLFTICLVLRQPLVKLLNQRVRVRLRDASRLPRSATERIFLVLATVARWSVFVYSVFLPLRLGTVWFYVGLAIALAGAALYTIAWVNFATTPIDEPVTKGLYRYSRHPMRLTPLLTLVGVSIATSSWLLLVLSAVFTFLSCITAIPGERYLLGRYGPAYRKYRDRTPRWVGKPG